MITCPGCGVEVQPDWDRCQACGFDPEGLGGSTAPGAARPPDVVLVRGDSLADARFRQILEPIVVV